MWASRHAAAVRERIARIEAGEEQGGSFDPVTDAEVRDILIAAGMTDSDIRHIRDEHEVYRVLAGDD
jgi:hypothetical protein